MLFFKLKAEKNEYGGLFFLIAVPLHFKVWLCYIVWFIYPCREQKQEVIF